jgi:general secretion pathway protein J
MRRRAHTPRGFTLVELLIALALTGLVTLLLLSATRMAALGINRVSAQAERLEARRTLEEMLRRALSSAVASPLLPSAPPLVGGPEKLEFLSLAEDSGAGLYRVSLAVERSALVLRRSRDGASGESAPERTLLAPRLASLAIAYFGAPAANAEPHWQERWEGSRRLPKLVRITLDTGDGIAWPPLVVRLWTAND